MGVIATNGLTHRGDRHTRRGRPLGEIGSAVLKRLVSGTPTLVRCAMRRIVFMMSADESADAFHEIRRR